MVYVKISTGISLIAAAFIKLSKVITISIINIIFIHIVASTVLFITHLLFLINVVISVIVIFVVIAIVFVIVIVSAGVYVIATLAIYVHGTGVSCVRQFKFKRNIACCFVEFAGKIMNLISSWNAFSKVVTT